MQGSFEVLPYSPFNEMISLLKEKRYYRDEDLKTIGLYSVPHDMKSGLDHIKLEYRDYIKDLNLMILEASIVDYGMRHLQYQPFIDDLRNTQVYLMRHPEIKNSKRLRASANEFIKYEFVTPYGTRTQRKHGLFKETAGTLGHISSDCKLDSFYIYCIAEIYGQIHFMEILDNIPCEAVYESHKEEIEAFESYIQEELDIIKVKYKLYDVKNNYKTLRNFETIELSKEK